MLSGKNGKNGTCWQPVPVAPPASPDSDRGGFDWCGVVTSERLDNTKRITEIEGDGGRLVAAWLGTPRYASACCAEPQLIGRILLMALPKFLAVNGWTLEGGIRSVELSERFEPFLPPQTKAIQVDVERRQAIPSKALLFLHHSDGQSAALSIEEDAMGVWQLTLHTTMNGTMAFFDAWHTYAAEHAYLRNKRFYANGEFVLVDPPIQFNDVYMRAETRQLVQRTILGFSRQAALYRRRGLSTKQGIILEGPPGVGKTMLCRALCSEINCTFIWVTARHLAKDGADTVAHVWSLARMVRPTVILLEDVDLFAESRDHTLFNGILGEMMNQMDGVENNDGILTIATTNRPSVIEKALRNRPGRFDRAIHFAPPDKAGREYLLRRHPALSSLDGTRLSYLAEEADGFTGAQLVDLVKTIVAITAEAGETDEPLMTREMVDRALVECRGLRKRKRRIGFAVQDDVE